MSFEAARGRLLVATPLLGDPNFRGSVIFLCRHDAVDGSLGFILNRPTEVPIGKALPDRPELAIRQERLWVGGPVEGGCLWALHRRCDLGMEGDSVGRGVYFSADSRVLRRLLATNGPDPAGVQFRLFVGYAGWGPGQLEAEINEGAWCVVPGLPCAVFSPDPARLWCEMSARALLMRSASPASLERCELS